jgi:hypothetical protein
MSSTLNPIASSNDNQICHWLRDVSTIIAFLKPLCSDLMTLCSQLVRRREVAEVPCAEELHQEEGDEPARQGMIDLRFVPRSLGASGCFLPVLDRCDELRPEIKDLRFGECTGGCSGTHSR